MPVSAHTHTHWPAHSNSTVVIISSSPVCRWGVIPRPSIAGSSEDKDIILTIVALLLCLYASVFIYGGPGLRRDSGRSSPESWSGWRGWVGCRRATRRTAPEHKAEKNVCIPEDRHVKWSKQWVRFQTDISGGRRYVTTRRNWLQRGYLGSNWCFGFLAGMVNNHWSTRCFVNGERVNGLREFRLGLTVLFVALKGILQCRNISYILYNRCHGAIAQRLAPPPTHWTRGLNTESGVWRKSL